MSKITTNRIAGDWYAAHCESHPHLQAEGRTRDEAKRKLREAIEQESVERRIKVREDRQTTT